MPEVRELPAGETARAARALLELRPHLGDAAALAARVDDVQRPQGYRLAASFEPGEEEASAAAGFRVMRDARVGPGALRRRPRDAARRRGRGHADALFAWLDEEARRARLRPVPPRLRGGPERADAHRFYFRHGMRIARTTSLGKRGPDEPRPVERRLAPASPRASRP